MDGLLASWLNLDDGVVFIPTASLTKLCPVSRDISLAFETCAARRKTSHMNHMTSCRWVRTSLKSVQTEVWQCDGNSNRKSLHCINQTGPNGGLDIALDLVFALQLLGMRQKSEPSCFSGGISCVLTTQEKGQSQVKL